MEELLADDGLDDGVDDKGKGRSEVAPVQASPPVNRYKILEM